MDQAYECAALLALHKETCGNGGEAPQEVEQERNTRVGNPAISSANKRQCVAVWLSGNRGLL